MKEFKKYLEDWPWEWFGTFTFSWIVKPEDAERMLKRWRIRLCKEEKIQVAYLGVLNSKGRPHLHLLMLGRNRVGKTLLTADIHRAERSWCSGAKIEPIYKKAGAIGYIVDQNMPHHHYHMVGPYNSKLLHKTSEH
jgi:hypothetical protein